MHRVLLGAAVMLAANGTLWAQFWPYRKAINNHDELS